ncbi:MAG: ChbG/HpnK family deacetylase, partial [Coriobacteriales bacterium]|nr:ChbG/HpnK family deacetylase [Coriobacteriales bacterium]
MKQLLIRADDLGYSYAVNLGIARAVKEGLVRSVGLMPNMGEASRGWEWIRDVDLAIGQHTNLCLGTPCADPSLIPSLLGQDGQLHSSREFRAAWAEGCEIVELDELVIEIEAQLARFREIVGKDPDYFEAHAIQSKRVAQAIHVVAQRHGLKEQLLSFDPSVVVRCGNTDVHMALEDMLPPEQYDADAFVRRIVQNMADGETYVLVFHPGYLDAFILENSSLTHNRTKEVDALINPELRSWLEAQPDLRLVDYR